MMSRGIRRTGGWALTAVTLVAAEAFLSGRISRESFSNRQMDAVQPYAEIKTVKLNELVPATPGTPDVYVRLIAIDGEVIY